MMSRTTKAIGREIILNEAESPIGQSQERIPEVAENLSPKSQRRSNHSPSPSNRGGGSNLASALKVKQLENLISESKDSFSQADKTFDEHRHSNSPKKSKLRTSRNSTIETDMKTFENSRRNKSTFGPSPKVEQLLWKKKDYIGPGNIGT